ncbi:MAG: PDZ domain-containing protein, partial [Verrucomicrobiaceae bacterium]
MKGALLAFLVLAQVPHALAERGEESSHEVLNLPVAAPRTWLGLKVEKLDDSVAAQVAELPPGFGFLVKSLDKDGPAQRAGLKELDILWKFGDQMLVNEGQLVALLRLAKPGEEIPLAVFRAGKPLELKVALGESPALQPPAPGEVSASLVPTVSAVSNPPRVVSVADRTASYAAEDGSAVVWNEDSGFKVRISNPKNEVIHEGSVSREGDGEGVPDGWKDKVRVLCRTLDQSLSGNLNHQRQPRPRV